MQNIRWNDEICKESLHKSVAISVAVEHSKHAPMITRAHNLINILPGYILKQKIKTVQYRYNASNFLQNSHNRHPLAHPWDGVSVLN